MELVALGVVADQAFCSPVYVVDQSVEVGMASECQPHTGFSDDAKKARVVPGELFDVTGSLEFFNERHRHLVGFRTVQREEFAARRLVVDHRGGQPVERAKIDGMIKCLIAVAVDQTGIQGFQQRIVQNIKDAVAREAQEQGHAPATDAAALEALIDAKTWGPVYRPYRAV